MACWWISRAAASSARPLPPTEPPMLLMVETNCDVRCIYGEAIELAALGHVAIRRASHVEPGSDGHWRADLTPVSGPTLGPFTQRSAALAAESAWLEAHWLDSELR